MTRRKVPVQKHVHCRRSLQFELAVLPARAALGVFPISHLFTRDLRPRSCTASCASRPRCGSRVVPFATSPLSLRLAKPMPTGKRHTKNATWVPRHHLSAISSTLVHELSSFPPERQFPYSILVRHLMPNVAPAARVSCVVEAISGLQRLQREMARLSQGDENYESKKRALQTSIRELRKMISAKA